ncbi:response regulator transcription factor [Salegentibacter chungangensis]|uniref:Response regulator transcription factor n=1 Tax=Salegentibacter chungangensis TaxID=1335724 RepID=A0ABW3NT73_9FLAO
MQKDLKKISDYWQEMYSRQVKEYRPFEISEDFKKFASIFALGNSYFYIVNLHNFELEYISESVKRFVNKDITDIDIKDLLKSVIPEELEIINYKSRVISDFYTNFLDKEEVLSYKNMFSYRMKDPGGQIRTMLYQAFPLSVLENGTPEHVFCIQTDVSHLKVTSTNTVSFIHMNGGESYLNVDISSGEFDPKTNEEDGNDFSELLTTREKEIVMRLSRGLNAEQIAEELNLSPHTIKTHRRNILEKSGCTNTTEVVAKCLINGIISP